MAGPVNVGSPTVELGQTAQLDKPRATEGRNVGGSPATFFKAIGHSIAKAFEAIGRGIASLAPKTTPVSQGLDRETKATFDKYNALMKQSAALEEAGDTSEAGKAEAKQVKSELTKARLAVVRHLKQEFADSELIADLKLTRATLQVEAPFAAGSAPLHLSIGMIRI